MTMKAPRVLIRLDLEQSDHQKVRVAAAKAGLPMSEFARIAVLAAAKRAIKDAFPENEPFVQMGVEGGLNVADEDIRNGRVKSFDNMKELIASLKQP